VLLGKDEKTGGESRKSPVLIILVHVVAVRCMLVHKFLLAPMIVLQSVTRCRAFTAAPLTRRLTSSAVRVNSSASPPPGIPLQFGHPDINLQQPASAGSAQRNANVDAVFLLTAASRGLGLELTRQLLTRTKGHIVATCRSPSAAEELQALASSSGSRVSVVQLDVTDQSSVEAAGKHIAAQHSGRLDALFNVAGLLGDGKTTPGPERSLAAIQVHTS
jgi:short chain dehydrogenase